MYKNFFKRILDILIALMALIVLSPLIIVLITLLIFANNGNPFFFQKRPGNNFKTCVFFQGDILQKYLPS